MDSTIEVLNSVDVGGILTVACEMSDGNLAVGNQDGIVNIISWDSKKKKYTGTSDVRVRQGKASRAN